MADRIAGAQYLPYIPVERHEQLILSRIVLGDKELLDLCASHRVHIQHGLLKVRIEMGEMR